MDKPKRQRVEMEELDLVSFWLNWRTLSKKIGLTSNYSSNDAYVNYMNQAIVNYEAESLFATFETADFTEWTRYLEEYPPSPEALYILVMLGKENYLRLRAKKAGEGKGRKNREVIKEAIDNQTSKTRKTVVFDLESKGISPRTINRHTAGKLKKPKT